MKQQPNLEAALDDLEIIEGVNPYDPTEKVFTLHNKNNSQPIRATIEKRALDNFFVEKPDRSFKRQYFPQQEEIRIPPGGNHILGRKVLNIMVRILPAPNYKEVLDIPQQFLVLGASYLNSWPPPPSPEVAETFIWVRSIPIEGSPDPAVQVMDIAVNSHWYRSIEITITDLAGHGIWGDTLLPEKQTHFNPVGSPVAYRVRGARFTS